MNQIEKAKSVSLPPLWIGFALSILFLIGAIVVGVAFPEIFEEYGSEGSSPAEAIFAIIWLPGFIYWLVCVHRIHKVILELTGSTYPITPARAVWFHFIPFYNLYWIFKWPSEVIKFINVNSAGKQISAWAPGVWILLGFLIGDGIGLLLMFAGLRGIMTNLKMVLQFPLGEAAPSTP